jgi:TetR/AcrR family transcriptional repressor of lmrAB and yxaGH operons
MREKSHARDQIVGTASRLFFSQGYHATGLNQIIKESDAPKGSLYYYFPNGKEELALVCIEQHKLFVHSRIREHFAVAANFIDGMQALIHEYADEVILNDYQSFAPSGFWNAVETSCISDRLRIASQSSFAEWKAVIVEQLREEDYEEDRVEEISTGMISLMEGSFVLALTYRDVSPLITAAKLVPLIARNK